MSTFSGRLYKSLAFRSDTSGSGFRIDNGVVFLHGDDIRSRKCSGDFAAGHVCNHAAKTLLVMQSQFINKL